VGAQAREAAAVGLHVDAAPERAQALRRAGLDADVGAEQADLLQHREHVRVHVVGPRLHHDRHVADAAREQLVAQRGDPGQVVGAIAGEGVVVVEHEQPRAALAPQPGHLVGDVRGAADPVRRPLRLLQEGVDAAERAVP
jgi:hypothetical protein